MINLEFSFECVGGYSCCFSIFRLMIILFLLYGVGVFTDFYKSPTVFVGLYFAEKTRIISLYSFSLPIWVLK